MSQKYQTAQPPIIRLSKRLRKKLGLDHVNNEKGSGAPPMAAQHSAETDTNTTHDGKTYTEDQLIYLVSEVKDYQLTHGSLLKLVRFESDSSVPGRPVGVSVLPTAFPKRCFQEAVELNQAYNELYIRVACDPDWLHSVLGPLIEHDEFIAALWNVYLKVRDANAIQDVVCGLFRNDYMIHQPVSDSQPQIKQVEMNTFSAAGACHAERIGKMHRHVGKVRGLSIDELERLPPSSNTQSIVDLLKAAHDEYSSTAPSSRKKCVLMTVQPFNFNIADERPIVYGLWEIGIPCYRCEWQTVLESTTLTSDRTLLFRPPVGLTNEELEVTVVYYRGGYEAAEYRERSIETRIRLEMCSAIKSPDILTHLTTFKEVQRALALPGTLERFVSAEQAEMIRGTFMSMMTLDSSPEGLRAREMATDPEQAVNYVLKPNRDGGGHNIYRADIPDFLSKQPKEQWHKYVLMRLIESPTTEGTLMMPEDLYQGSIISELGILGTCLWKRIPPIDGKAGAVEILKNDFAGWTFKTKPAEIDEMSVVKGYGCFDCPLLVE